MNDIEKIIFDEFCDLNFKGFNRNMWQIAYRSKRKYAHISCSATDFLVKMRCYGCLLKVWRNQINVGRMRFNDLKHPNFTTNLDKTKIISYPTDYNPNRIIENQHC